VSISVGTTLTMQGTIIPLLPMAEVSVVRTSNSVWNTLVRKKGCTD